MTTKVEACVPTENDASIRPEAQRILNAMLPAATLRELSQRSNLRGGAFAIGHLLVVAVLCYLSLAHQSTIAFAAQCFVMAFLFNGEHELVHRTVFHSPADLNDAFALVYGLLTTRPPKHYTFYHFNHHKFTGDPATDPELQDSFIDMRLDRPLSYLTYLSGLPFWIDRSSTLVRHAVFEWVLPHEALFLTDVTRPKMIAEARLFVAVYSALAVAAWYAGAASVIHQVIVWGWAIPSLLAQPFLRFYLVAEHTGCPTGANMLSNTRTTKTWTWYRWLAWNMPYHAEHHAYPMVPFHRLGDLHQALVEASTQQHRSCSPSGENGYMGVHVGLIRKFFFA
jgi:fatty acid desaturase